MTKNEVSTLKKGLLILDLVKQRKGITLREVMDEQNLSKSTAFRLLTTLEEHRTMNFELSQFHKAIKDSAVDFAKRRLIPQIPKLKETGEFPRDIIREMGELGFFGCTFPEKYLLH